jgi:hypothetical protein
VLLHPINDKLSPREPARISHQTGLENFPFQISFVLLGNRCIICFSLPHTPPLPTAYHPSHSLGAYDFLNLDPASVNRASLQLPWAQSNPSASEKINGAQDESFLIAIWA